MKIEKAFTVPVSDSIARYRISNYFDQAGYRPVDIGSRVSTYKRGSRLGSWFPQNPASLLSIAEIEVLPKGSQTDIRAGFEIKTTIRDESHFTEKFWNNEVKEFETALLEDRYSPLKEKKLTRQTIWANVRSLGSALTYIFVWGLIALVLTFIMIYMPGTENLDPFLVAFSIMIISAVATFYLVRRWRRRRRI